MTSYQGRRAPNVSQYIAELNTVPSDQDMAIQPSQENGLGLSDDFALFTNAEFYDFDLGDLSEFSPTAAYDPAQEERARRLNASAFRQETTKSADAFSNGNFQFDAFSQFPNMTADPHAANIQTNPYPLNAQGSPTVTSPISPQSAVPGAKRKLNAINSPKTPNSGEETARVAAEEDKRRRNTAASARFRVKKKQREQALERTAKEMTEKVSSLEARVMQLETENKWLKNLLTEKHDNKSSDTAEAPKMNAAATNQEMDSRSTSGHTDGVGTEEEVST